MKQTKHPGHLVAVGGKEDKESEQPVILREFLRLAGGSKARVAVVTAATDHVDEVGRTYCELFSRLGAAEARVVDVSSREDARNPTSIEVMAAATGIYFTGGDQLHITSLIGGTPMDTLLHERVDRGAVVGGTSAGAAMMSSSMILGGGSEENPRLGSVRLGPGMDFIHGAIIDTHFSQRGRHGRLLAAAAQYPHCLGLGIDEDTALVADGERFTVIGAGSVTVFDVGAATHVNLPDLGLGEGMALFDVRIHVLTAGYGFSLSERQPLVPDRSAA